MECSKNEADPKIRTLYPGLSEEELRIARGKLNEYAELALRIYRRIASDPNQYRKLRTLTERESDRTIDLERSTNKHFPNT
jgi:hypothetical protein